VQVGAYSSRAKAEADWNRMSGRVSALSGLSHRIVEGQADIGKVYRLQAVASDAAAANALCNKLKAAGQNCFVKD
jgi:cell division protein FtsN